jgi:hypothetical protein
MKKIIYLFVFIILISACKKKEDPAPVPVDKTSMMTKKWKANGTTPINYYTFNSDGTGLYEGGTFSWTLTWYFTNNQANFHMVIAFPTPLVDDYNIEKLTDTEFNFYQPSNNAHYELVKF